MSVYGHVQWLIDTYEPVIYVVSGECPSANLVSKGVC
jgi:hypothetical protein